ncbi:hypothetical protein C9374_000555 [Naegleria lovaniensis]|uniref:HAM1-like N-terminal domain-containing protein n=1 Tax=Naegleria lovaniensis TaxID=51637 RepID=A0AA88KP87_NAELO|nr:uncharacterized protein C9374_000555 [Naegleria lovaniensis]KAG2388391.1 hypothetical protein C9374_000555 [Naegleria lovaniensis]
MVEIKTTPSGISATTTTTAGTKDVTNVTVESKAIDQTVEQFENLVNQGEIPSNTQLLQGVEQVQQVLEKTSSYITQAPNAQNIQKRTLHLLDIVKDLIQEKNPNDTLQRFVSLTNKIIRKYADQVKDITQETSQQLSGTSQDVISSSSQTLEQQVREKQPQVQETLYDAVRNFSNFIFELFRSPHFRLLMIDTLNYLRVLFRSNLKSIERQTDEGLKQAIQRLVNTFQDEEIEEKVSEYVESAKDKVLKEGVPQLPGVSEQTKKEIQSDWSKPLIQVGSQKSSQQQEPQASSTQKQRQEEHEQLLHDEKKMVDENVPSDEQISLQKDVEQKEQLEDQLFDRFNQLIQEFSQNPSYKKSVLGFFNIFDQLKNILVESVSEQKEQAKESLEQVKNDLTEQTSQLVRDMRNDPDFQELLDCGKQLIVQWTGGDEQIVNAMRNSLRDIYRAFKNDKELNELFQESENDIKRYLDNPQLMQQELNHIKYNLRRIREKIVEKKDLRAIDRFNSQLNRAIQKMRNDELLNELNAESRQLLSDLFLDSKGEFTFKTETIQELRTMLVALLKESVEKLTDLDIHYIDSDLEYKLSNLHINASDILPSHVAFSAHSVTNIDYSEENLAQSLQGTKSILVMHLSGMVCHLKDVQFSFQRFSFPQISDEGLLDIDTGDIGLMIHSKILIDTTTPTIGNEFFLSESVSVDIDELKLTFTKTAHHQLLLKLLSPFIQNNVRRKLKEQIQYVLNYSQQQALHKLNRALEQTMKSNKGNIGLSSWVMGGGSGMEGGGGSSTTTTTSDVLASKIGSATVYTGGYQEL